MAELAVKQATFLWEGKDKKGNRVKGRGVARDEMEIRSAGPDRKMWTTDDVVMK